MGELFVGFLQRLAVAAPFWEVGQCVCADAGSGQWCYRSWGEKPYTMAVQDPFARHENLARSVRDITAERVAGAMKGSASDLLALLDGIGAGGADSGRQERRGEFVER